MYGRRFSFDGYWDPKLFWSPTRYIKCFRGVPKIRLRLCMLFIRDDWFYQTTLQTNIQLPPVALPVDCVQFFWKPQSGVELLDFLRRIAEKGWLRTTNFPWFWSPPSSDGPMAWKLWINRYKRVISYARLSMLVINFNWKTLHKNIRLNKMAQFGSMRVVMESWAAHRRHLGSGAIGS